MTSLGEDIKEVFTEIGSEVHLLRESGIVSGEFLLFKPEKTGSADNIELGIKAQFPYDSSILAADVLQIQSSGQKFLVVHKNPEDFEDATFRSQAVLSKINVYGHLKRSSGEVRSTQTYQKTHNWNTVKSICYGTLLTLPRTKETEFTKVGLIPDSDLGFLVPHSYGIRPMDRVFVSGETGAYFQVSTVNSWTYNNVDFCSMIEDTRQ